MTSRDFERIDYNSKDLHKLFIRFNECSNSKQVQYAANQRKDMFNLAIRPGLNLSRLIISNWSNESWTTVFRIKPGLRFGVETEFILPFNKNKWSIIAEPTFQYYRSESTIESDDMPLIILVARANYRSTELPLELRHYFFL